MTYLGEKEFQMSRARDLATLAGSATVLATDSEVSAAIAAIPTPDLSALEIADVMDSL
jgi:hypothetical protein